MSTARGYTPMSSAPQENCPDLEEGHPASPPTSSSEPAGLILPFNAQPHTRPLDPRLTTERHSSNISNYSLDSNCTRVGDTRLAPDPDGVLPFRLSGGGGRQKVDHSTPSSPPKPSSSTFAPIDEENDYAPPPPKIIAAAFEGRHGYEEDKFEEVEGDEAPRPPSMIAAEIGAADQDAKKRPPVSIEGGVDPQVPAEKKSSANEVKVEEKMRSTQEIVNSLSRVISEVFNYDCVDRQVPAEHLLVPPPSLNQPPSGISNARVDAFSTTPTPRRGDEPRFSFPTGNQGGVETTVPLTPESMPPPQRNFDPYNQQLPLLEATLVVPEEPVNEPVYIHVTSTPPEEPVYDAVRITSAEGNNAPGWLYSKKGSCMAVVVVLVLGVIGAVVSVSMQNDAPDPIMTSTSSTAITSGTTITTSAGSTNSMICGASTNIIPAMAETETTVSEPTGMPDWKLQVRFEGDCADDKMGTSVALSADAKTIAAGAPYSNKLTGYVVVYQADEDGGKMMPLGKTIYGNAPGDRFGWSLDISADGITLAVGSPGEWTENDRPGYVRVYTLVSDGYLGSIWEQLGEDIIGEAKGDQFGASISLSHDGKFLAVGASTHDGRNGVNSGHVRIYHLTVSGTNVKSWEQVGQDIDGEAEGDSSGYSVSLSEDAKTVAIGSTSGKNEAGDTSGHVRVHRMDSEGSSWEQLGKTISGDAADDQFGKSLRISPGANTLVVGSPGRSKNDRPGYVKVYTLQSNYLDPSWEQLGGVMIGKADGDQFGESVSLSSNNYNMTVAVGAIKNNGGWGHVRVYQYYPGQNWTLLGGDINGEQAGDNSGVSVSLSADAKMVAIGSDRNDDNGFDAGHIRVFALE